MKEKVLENKLNLSITIKYCQIKFDGKFLSKVYYLIWNHNSRFEIQNFRTNYNDSYNDIVSKTVVNNSFIIYCRKKKSKINTL